MTTADRSAGRRLVFEDHFDASELNLAVWLPHYLPAWGSLAATAASYDIHDSCLHLRIPTDQGRWLPQVHPAPLRVSGIQSGNFSGPVGQEDSPERSAEICVTEMFGDAVEPGGSTAVGMGLHPFRDPAVAEDFEAVRLPIDLGDFHTYAVDWTADQVEFFVDGQAIRTCADPPRYPMQMMIAVFDFPDRTRGGDDTAVPELVVDYLRCYD